MLAKLDPVRIARLGAVAIAVLAALGMLHALGRDGGPGVRLPLFGLDEEWSVPALFSGALLAFAALTCALTAAAGGLERVPAPCLPGLAALFGFMAVDEVVQIHERLERIAETGWQTIYLPLAAIGGVLWLGVLRGLLANPRAAMVFAGGGAAWFVAQLFEKVQRDGAVLQHRWTILPEELLEMTGSLLLGLAVLAAARAAHVARAAPGRELVPALAP